MNIAFSTVCTRNFILGTLDDYRICILNHLADGILSKIKTSSSFKESIIQRTMQKFCVLRNIHSPTFEVVVHFRSSDEEASVDIQVHHVCTI